MSKYVISINYGELDIPAGEEYEAAYREYNRALTTHPQATVTLLEDEAMIKEREVGETPGWEQVETSTE